MASSKSDGVLDSASFNSLDDLVNQSILRDLSSRFHRDVLLVHDESFLRGAIEWVLKENSLSVVSSSNFEGIKNKLDDANILIAKVTESNIEELNKIRKSYLPADLLIVALAHPDLLKKVYELEGVITYPSKVKAEEILKIAKAFSYDYAAVKELKKDLSILIEPTAQSIRNDLKQNDVFSASKKINVLKKYFFNDERVLNIVYHCFKYAQRKEIHFPGIQTAHYTKTTDEFYISDELVGLSAKILGMVFGKSGIKKYKSIMRAECEAIALKTIEERNKSNLWGALENIKINAPVLVTPKPFKPDDEVNAYYLFMEYVEGPSLRDVMIQCNTAEKKGDEFAKHFKKAVLYELNKNLAFFQTNGIPIPEKYLVNIQFVERTKLNFSTNLDIFFTKKYVEQHKSEIDYLNENIKLLFETLPDFKPVQFFDFYIENIRFDIGEGGDTTFIDIENRYRDEYSSVSYNSVLDFVRKITKKVDYNRINFQTIFNQDLHIAYINSELTKEEQKPFDYHFLLWKKRADLLKKIDMDDKTLENLVYIDSLIKKIENDSYTDDDFKKIEKECEDDFALYEDSDALIRFFVAFSAFGTLLKKSIPYAKRNADKAYNKMDILFNKDIDKRNVKTYFSNFFKKETKFTLPAEKRRFIHPSFFSTEVINKEIYKYVAPEKIKDFVQYTNIFMASDKNLRDHLRDLKTYFNNAFSAINEIIEESEKHLSEKYKEIATRSFEVKESMPLFESLKNYSFSDEKSKKYFLRLVSACCIKNFLDIIKENGLSINYKVLYDKYKF